MNNSQQSFIFDISYQDTYHNKSSSFLQGTEHGLATVKWK